MPEFSIYWNLIKMVKFKDLPVGTLFFGIPYNDGIPTLMYKSIHTKFTTQGNKRIEEDQITFIHFDSGRTCFAKKDSQYPHVHKLIGSMIIKSAENEYDKDSPNITNGWEKYDFPSVEPVEECFKSYKIVKDYRFTHLAKKVKFFTK